MCGESMCTAPQMGGGRRTRKRGGGCGCGVPLPTKGFTSNSSAKMDYPKVLKGGYRATKRNLHYLRLWKKGKSIGFTMKSSLKAKGLIPRSNGTRKVSPKYR